MSMESQIVVTLKDAGIDDPISTLLDLARKMTVADICEMFGIERSKLVPFLHRRKIECVVKKEYLRDIIGDDIDEILPMLGQTMTCSQIAQKYKVPIKKIGNYMAAHNFKAVKIRKTKNDDEFASIPMFLCDDCKKPNAITLMSSKKDVCQRCLKNQIRGRV